MQYVHAYTYIFVCTHRVGNEEGRGVGSAICT